MSNYRPIQPRPQQAGNTDQVVGLARQKRRVALHSCYDCRKQKRKVRLPIAIRQAVVLQMLINYDSVTEVVRSVMLA